MSSAETVAAAHYQARRRLIEAVRDEASRAWRNVEFADLNGSWRAQSGLLLVALAGAQFAAAETADSYMQAVLAAQDVDPTAEGRFNAGMLAGVASDGRNLASLLDQGVIATKMAIGLGVDQRRAMATGYATLDSIVRTQVADAGRSADSVAMVARRNAGGYVRMVVGRTCGRCVVLAGRWYRWNGDFNRHPCCDCVGVPSREDTANEIATDPKAWFASLDKAEQDKQFTKAGAQAIRDGADIASVVNARRGAFGLTPAGARLTAEEARALRGGLDRGRLQTQSVFGRDLFTTTEAVTTRGRAGVLLGAKETGQKTDGRYRSAKGVRLMPESIYQIAGNDREEAIRLLRRFGYLL